MVKQITQIRVRYADTDQMKAVYHAKYLEYFEQGRSDLLRSVGMPYAEIEAQGYYLPVIEVTAKYRRSARYDELLRVESTVSDPPVVRIRIDYRVFGPDDEEPIAEGYTVHGFVNASTGKPTRAPAQFLQVLEEALKENTVYDAEERTA
jgi:acyl-CoA thioester hydrolase